MKHNPGIDVYVFTGMAGCDQAGKAQQLMGKAAESAKQAIDDTTKPPNKR
jgi:uncharacterized protein YjbJ (UPF0337 family)